MGHIFVEGTICGPHILFQRNIGLELSCMQDVYERYCCPIISNIGGLTIQISGTGILFEGCAGSDRYFAILHVKEYIYNIPSYRYR